MENGKYRARAREWDLGIAGTGKEQLAIAFDFLDHPGQSMTAYLYFTDETFDRTLKSLREMGWTGDDFDNITDLDRNEVQLVVEAEVNPKTGQAEPRIKWINNSGGLALKQAMDPAQRKSFAARMKGKVLQADRAAGRTPGSAGAAQRNPWEAGDNPPV